MIASIDEAPAYIMSCSEVINSHFIGYFLQKRPFQVVVAQGTGNRGMTCHIFVDEIVNDGFPEGVTNIVCEMGDVQTFT